LVRAKEREEPVGSGVHCDAVPGREERKKSTKRVKKTGGELQA